MNHLTNQIESLSPKKRELLLRRLQAQQPESRPAPTLPAIAPRKEEWYQPFPLTDIQQVYWLGRSGQFDLGDCGTNIYMEFEITGMPQAIQPFFLKRINAALQQLVERHAMLRMVVLPDGTQRILPEVPAYELSVVNLRKSAPEAVEAALASTRERMRYEQAPIDRWPLFEVLAHLVDRQRMILHFRFDSLLMDGTSRLMLVNQLFELVSAPGSFKSPLECTYRDFAITWWDLQKEDHELYRISREYWLNRVRTLPPAPELPLLPARSSAHGARLIGEDVTLLDAEAWTRLKNRAARSGVTPSGIGAAAFAEVLALWSGSTHYTIGLISTYRPPLHPQMAEMIGNFNTISLLEVDVSRGTFEERAKRVQQQMMADLEYRNFTGHQVLRELNRIQGRVAQATVPIFFNSVIEYSHPSYQLKQDERVDDDSADAGGSRRLLSRSVRALIGRLAGAAINLVARRNSGAGPQVQAVDVGLYVPQVLMEPTLIDGGEDGLLCKWQVIKEFFPEGVPQAMLDAYRGFLLRLAEQEESWAETARDALLPADQLEQRARLNSTEAPLPSKPLHALIQPHAKERPRQPAVVGTQRVLSYNELYRTSNMLGRHLRELGAQPNTPVAVVMERGWEAVVGLLGVLASGAAYMPLDPTLPKDRLWSLLEHSQAKLVLTQSWLDQKLEWPAGVQRLPLDRLDLSQVDDRPPEQPQRPDDLACVLYRPDNWRGVMLSHRALANTILDINRRFEVGPGDHTLALAPLSSDISIYDMLGTLAAGGTLSIPDAEFAADPAHWAALLTLEQITIWNSTPAMLEQLLAYLARRGTGLQHALRLVLLSRDHLPLSLADRVKAALGKVQVISLTGEPENGIWSTFYPVEQVDRHWQHIPAGQPLANQRCHILNEALEPCPDWVVGEIYISGAGLAQGYWRDESATRERFVVHPRTGERLYRTGELGRYLPGGAIEPLGRRESLEVERHGSWARPRQVEALLERHPDLWRAVVVAGEERALIAYVVARPDAAPTRGELRAFLRRHIPEHELPAAFVRLKALPLTADGRVDRSALPGPGPLLDPSEELLADLWAGLLGVEQVGRDDSFFELGGTSLTAARLVAQVRETFGVTISLRDLLAAANLGAMSGLIGEARAHERGNGTVNGQKLALRDATPASLEIVAAPPVAPAHASNGVERDPARQRTAKKQPSQAPTPAPVEKQEQVMQPQPSARSMRIFFLVALGQFVSLVGSNLSNFALGVWVYMTTGSVMQFALISVFATLPTIILSPLAGALVDRWDRHRILVMSDSIAALCTVSIAVLFLTRQLDIMHIYATVLITAIVGAFQQPAAAAIIPLLVPKEHLGRANGLMQALTGIGQLVAPALAGVLVVSIQLFGVLMIDGLTFVFAITTLLLARIPRLRPAESPAEQQPSLRREIVAGWTFVRDRPGLMGMLILIAISNFVVGILTILATPLILAFSTPAALGAVTSISGSGILVGGIAMGIWGGPKRRILGMIGAMILGGVFIMLAGLQPSVLLIGAAAFGFFATMPIGNGSGQAIFQSKVPPELLGRVGALINMVATSALPLAYLAAGPLADSVFEPLLAVGGPLAGSVGQLIGMGPGRGIGLLFIVAGFLAALVPLVAYLHPRVRLIEDELPDVIQTPEAAEAEAGAQEPAVAPTPA